PSFCSRVLPDLVLSVVIPRLLSLGMVHLPETQVIGAGGPDACSLNTISTGGRPRFNFVAANSKQRTHHAKFDFWNCRKACVWLNPERSSDCHTDSRQQQAQSLAPRQSYSTNNNSKGFLLAGGLPSVQICCACWQRAPVNSR